MSDLRQRIAEAAHALYMEQGLPGISMRKIASRVGVSAPAIYRHYRNKDALLNEIVVTGLGVLEEYLRPALDAATPRERVLQLTERYLSFAEEQPRYFDFAFMVPDLEIRALADEVQRPVWATFRRAIDQVAACIDAGQLAREDPLETAILLWAEVHGLVTLYRLGRLGQDAEAFRVLYRRAVRRLLRGLAVQ